MSTIDRNGKTRILCVSLVVSEDEESFIWAFKVMQEDIGVNPVYIFTNEDAAIKLVIANIYPDTTHIYCIWHISTNF